MLLAFLGFVVLLSGFVAYAADTIARRVGRRHLRLFGLRPKTTALIVAVASGMGISLASVLTFAALNRQAIFNIAEADKVRLELRDLRTSVQATEAELGQVSRQRDAAVAQAKTLQAQRQQAIKDRDEANAEVQISAALLQQSRDSRAELYSQAQALSDRVQELADRRDQLSALAEASQRDLSRTQAETRRLAAQVKAAQSQVVAAQAQVKAAQARAAAAQAQVVTTQAQVRELTNSRAALQARVREAEAQVKAAQGRAAAAAERARGSQAQVARVQGRLTALAANVDKLQGTRSQLQADRDRLTRELLSLKAVRDSLQRDNTTLQQGLDTAVAERDRLQADVQSVTSELSATRSGGLVYRRGDPVWAGVVASVYSLPDALQQADLNARAHGAGGRPAAALPAALQQQLQAKLRGLNTTALVSCRAASNTAAGYPVELSCDAVANTLLYRRGDVIRSAQVDLGGSPDQLRVQLLDLESAVLQDLSSRGVPPERVVGGGLTASELLDLLSQLRGRQPGATSATVSIAANADVRPGSRVDLYATVK